MDLAMPYNANRDDLYRPCKNAVFFATGVPTSEAALCAELSRLSYCRQESSFAFDQDRIRNVLSSVGFVDCQFFESQENKARGSHCFLAMQKDSEKDKEFAILVSRGTDADDPTDLGDDVDVLLTQRSEGGKVHPGFAHAFSELRPKLVPALQAIQCRVIFTGHSLGAAMATLFSSIKKPDFLYLFGSPRVGGPAFVATLNDTSSRRYVDCCDLVTRMPPEVLGYVHVGNPYYINFDPKVIFNAKNDYMEADQFRARESYLVNYSWKTGNVAIRDLADHAPINYVSAITANPS